MFNLLRYSKVFLSSKKGSAGMSEIIGIAITLVVAAFILLPGLRAFAQTVMTAMTTWFNSISTSIFQTS